MIKHILVAGAGKGIGKATADLAYERGHNIIAVSRTEEDLKNRPYKTLSSDLIYSQSISLLEQYASEIDAVINCTGTSFGAESLNERWDENVINLIEQNLKPALNIYKAFLPKFRERQRGHFVHISSGALDFYDETESGYCASKAALEAIVLTLQNGDIKTCIKHHALRVALTDTPLARRVFPNIDNWENRYTAKEIAHYLLDIIENPNNYPKPIIPLLYFPIRMNS